MIASEMVFITQGSDSQTQPVTEAPEGLFKTQIAWSTVSISGSRNSGDASQELDFAKYAGDADCKH